MKIIAQDTIKLKLPQVQPSSLRLWTNAQVQSKKHKERTSFFEK